MGCDIHTFLEYSTFADHNGDDYWQCFGGQFNPGRDYRMFGLLAGVRGGDALFEVRGLPEGKLSYQIEDYTRLRIADEGEEPTESEVSLEQARSWTQSRFGDGETIINDAQGKPRWVTDPDLHSHSWLTLAELKQVLSYYRLGDKESELEAVAEEDREVVTQAAVALLGGEQYSPEWDAIVAAMTALEDRGAKSRLVFCFDN